MDPNGPTGNLRLHLLEFHPTKERRSIYPIFVSDSRHVVMKAKLLHNVSAVVQGAKQLAQVHYCLGSCYKTIRVQGCLGAEMSLLEEFTTLHALHLSAHCSKYVSTICTQLIASNAQRTLPWVDHTMLEISVVGDVHADIRRSIVSTRRLWTEAKSLHPCREKTLETIVDCQLGSLRGYLRGFNNVSLGLTCT
jgi:hypothetical protein